MAVTQLGRKLRKAREDAGLGLNEAVKRMPHTSYGTLYHLEGRNSKVRPASPSEVRVKTVVDIIVCYWPAIRLRDFMPAAHPFDIERGDP